MNIELRTKAKNDFEKGLSRLMNNSVSERLGNIRNHKDVKLLITKKRRRWRHRLTNIQQNTSQKNY